MAAFRDNAAVVAHYVLGGERTRPTHGEHDRLARHRERRITVGSRLPLHADALGKVLLAFDPGAARSLAGKPLISLTHRTITDRVALQRELALVRDRGWAADVEEQEPGRAGIAAPIRDHGGYVVARRRHRRYCSPTLRRPASPLGRPRCPRTADRTVHLSRTRPRYPAMTTRDRCGPRPGHDLDQMHDLRPTRPNGVDRATRTSPIPPVARTRRTRRLGDLVHHAANHRVGAASGRHRRNPGGSARDHQSTRNNRGVESPHRNPGAPGDRLAGHPNPRRHCQLEQSEGDFSQLASAIHQVACDV